MKQPVAFCSFLLIAFASPLAAQGFGTTAAVGDGELFLSEPLNPYSPGTVFVFRPDGRGGWSKAAELKAPDGFNLDRFGRSISYSEGRLLIGSTSIDESAGAAYVFEKDRNGEWRFATKLVARATSAGDSHGRNVLLQGNRAYVASWGRNDGQGVVTVWQRQTDGTWTEAGTLQASDGRPGDFFGTGLAADGDLVLVGAAQRDTAKGAASLFRYDPGARTWSQETRLVGRGLVRNSGFGGAVALRAGAAYVAAPGLERGSGAVFVYRTTPAGNWTEMGRLSAFDGAAGAAFGNAMAFLPGGELWIGAPGASGGQGRIYRYGVDLDGEWSEVTRLGASGLSRGSGFGGALAVSAALAVVGIPGDAQGMGSAAVASRGTDGRWQTGAPFWVESKGLEAITGGKRDCTDGKVGLFECGSVDMLSYLPVSAIGGDRGIRLNDIWGWTDPQSGREIAIVGRTDGTAFVDVSDPVNPRYLGNLPKTAASPASVWRDMKVYKDHVFIVADGAMAHGMQVFDLTRLRTVRNAPVEFAPDAHYDRIASSHNIVIDTATGFAFAVGASAGGETCGGALHMIDIRDPKRPTFAGCFADNSTGRQGTGYTHDAQCVVYHGPDAAYAGRTVCFNSSETALGIADVTDKQNPKPIAHAAYPNVAYAHQGWLTDDHRYFYMNDEGDEGSGTVAGTRTLIWDLADLDEPVLAGEYVATTKSTDHNLYVKGNLMYQSNYLSGLRIVDITDPAKPVEVGFFDTVPVGGDTPDMDGSWSNYPYFGSGTIVVTSQAEGLFVLKKSDRPLIP